MKLWRSTIVAGMIAAGACSNASAITIDKTFTGAWTEAVVTNFSRGLLVEAFEIDAELHNFFVTGFVFAPDGSQLWFAGNDTEVVPGDTTVSFDAFQIVGGTPFGGPATTTTVTSLGSFDFEIITCNLATATFTSNDESVAPSFTTDFDRGAASIGNIVGPDECAYQEAFPDTGCPTGGIFQGPAPAVFGPRACAIAGTAVTGDITLTNNTLWVLTAPVFIGDGGAVTNDASITIEPGTRIVDDFSVAGTPSALFIARGAKLFSVGQPFAPIVFSSGLPTSSVSSVTASSAEFGGLVINGLAPVNNCPALPSGCSSEGDASVLYGGDDPFDSSGIIKYTRVQFGGFNFNDEDQLNGIAFQGVGTGTTVDYIQVHSNDDDGIEWFGGTVNVRHAAVTAVSDDSLDWVAGWQGSLQYAVVSQMGVGDQGIEADNFDDDNLATPRSQPRIANLTMVGTQDIGMLFREGTGVNLTNALVFGFGDGCLDIDDEATFTESFATDGTPNGTLTIQNTYLDCDVNFIEEDGDPLTVESIFTNADADNTTGFDLTGVFGSSPFPPSSTIGFLRDRPIDPTLFPNLDQVEFAGAFLSAETAWTAGWTIFLEQ